MFVTRPIQAFTSLLWAGVAVSIIAGCIVLSVGDYAHAQDITHTPSPTFSIDRTSYFAPGMQSAFGDDLDQYPHIPIYQGNLRLTLTQEAAVVLGTLNIVYTNTTGQPLDTVVLRLYPNLPAYGGRLTVHYIQVNRSIVDVNLDATGSILELPLPHTLQRDEEMTFLLQFESTIPAETINLYGQYSYLNGSLALANLLPLLSVYDQESGWWQETDYQQGDIVFSEVANFDITITAPARWQFITTGVTIDSDFNGDSTRTIHFIAPLVRDFAIMASPEYRTMSSKNSDGVQVDVHYLPGGETAARRVLTIAESAMQLFSAVWGPYPYRELDIVETFTTSGGLEYPTLVTIANDSWNAANNYLEVTVVHQVAHQWWSGLVGTNPQAEPFLDEALASYAVAVYAQTYQRSGADILQVYQNLWDQSPEDAPLGLPTSGYDADTYAPIIYGKGPLFFAELAADFGFDQLMTALSAFYFAFRYETVTIGDLRNSLESSFGRNLSSYFEQWVD